jgi:hypothetical protein
VPSRVMPVLFGSIAPSHLGNLNLYVLVLKPEGFMTAYPFSNHLPFPDNDN